MVDLGEYYHVITGVLLVFTIIANPEGIISEVHKANNWLRGKVTGRSQDETPPELLSSTEALSPPPESAREVGEVLLSSTSIGVHYGGVTAVDDVTFDVRDGEIIGLIGPNGAGKTTFIDAISGFADAAGSVVLDGERLDGRRPHERSRRGLGRTFQGIELYDDLSVRENVTVGTTAARHCGRPTESGDDDLERLFDVLHLTPVVDRPVKELSQGRRQLVSVARALAGRPRVVLLDEPAAGLDSAESVWLGHRLRAIRDAGLTIVMVDHDMELVLEVCDRIVVLDLGRVIAIGTPDEIRNDPVVTSAYLGVAHARQELKA
nr:ABC transporter ATP-binding protein [Gordonia paraffinivorans]